MTEQDELPTSTITASGRRRRAATLAASLVLLGLAGVFFLLQVRIVDHDTGASRACGSAFDSAADRSGWEQWWAADLDEPDAVVRSSLPRTRLCPAAVNQRAAVAGLLAAGGASTAVLYMLQRRRVSEQGVRRSVTGRRLLLLGRSTAVGGGVLVAGGIVAIVMLVADSGAPVFRYVDRPVVFMVGLLVLTPALIMVAFGLALSFAGRHVDRRDRDG